MLFFVRQYSAFRNDTFSRLRLAGGLFLLLVMSLQGGLAHARGTPAGTQIGNQAELYFSSGGVSAVSVKSNTVVFTVEEIIDVSVQSLDGANVAAGSPDASVPLSFRVTNIGNGPERFRLERVSLAAPGDFSPVVAALGSIFLENGLQAGFQASGPNADTVYVSGSTDLSLQPDAALTVYLVSDFAPNLGNGTQGRASIRATSLTPGAAGSAPGKVLGGQGLAGGIAVVGASAGVSEAIGAYQITGLRLLMSKTQVAVRSPNGGSDFIPGAECDYQIDVQLQGSSGQIDDVVVDDPLPQMLRYVSESLKINGVARTDAADSDDAQVVSDRILIKLGRLVPSMRFVITYTTRLQ